MSHAHTWKVIDYLLLSLPTREQFSERLMSWHCMTCSAWCDITGEVKHTYPLRDPDFWTRLAARQQGHGSISPVWRNG